MTSSGIYKNDGDFDVYINIADIPELNVVKVNNDLWSISIER